jgi:RNA polymerase sigma-70 factor (ECF subfamily)
MPESNHHDFLRCFLQEEVLLRAFLFGATGNADAAEELLQIIAGTLWEKWDQFDPTRPFRPWALGMARLEVLKWRQHLARSKEVLSPEAIERLAEAATEQAQEIDSRYRFLRECLDTLKGRSRGVLRMKYGEGLKIAQIAERLGRSVEAVEMILVRARRVLRDCIDRKLAKAEGGRL